MSFPIKCITSVEQLEADVETAANLDGFQRELDRFMDQTISDPWYGWLFITFRNTNSYGATWKRGCQPLLQLDMIQWWKMTKITLPQEHVICPVQLIQDQWHLFADRKCSRDHTLSDVCLLICTSITLCFALQNHEYMYVDRISLSECWFRMRWLLLGFEFFLCLCVWVCVS